MVYEVLSLPWQIAEAEGVGVLGVPTVEVTITVAVPVIVLEHDGIV